MTEKSEEIDKNFTQIENRILRLESQVTEILDILEQFARDLELAEVNITRSFKGLRPEKPQQAITAIQEAVFTALKFEPQKGAKIGDYETAFKESNVPDNWNSAYNILKVNNATIANRYHGPTYEFSYWLYGEGKIFRQKLKKDGQP